MKLAFYDEFVPAMISGERVINIRTAVRHLNQATPQLLLLSDATANFGPVFEVACAD